MDRCFRKHDRRTSAHKNGRARLSVMRFNANPICPSNELICQYSKSVLMEPAPDDHTMFHQNVNLLGGEKREEEHSRTVVIAVSNKLIIQ